MNDNNINQLSQKKINQIEALPRTKQTFDKIKPKNNKPQKKKE